MVAGWWSGGWWRGWWGGVARWVVVAGVPGWPVFCGSFRAPSAIRYLAGSMTKGLVMSPEIEAFVERVVDKVVEMSLDVGQCPADWVASIDGIRSALADHAAAVRT